VTDAHRVAQLVNILSILPHDVGIVNRMCPEFTLPITEPSVGRSIRRDRLPYHESVKWPGAFMWGSESPDGGYVCLYKALDGKASCLFVATSADLPRLRRERTAPGPRSLVGVRARG